MGEYVEDLLDNNDLSQDFLDALDDDLLLRELVQRELEIEQQDV